MKPQASHLQTRVEYLLRLVTEEARLKQTGRKASECGCMRCHWMCLRVVQNAKASRLPRGARRGAGRRTEVITDYFEQDGSSKDSLTVNIPRELLVGPMESEGRRKRPGNLGSQRQRSQAGPAAKRARMASHRRKNRVRQEDSASLPDAGDMELDDSTFKKVRADWQRSCACTVCVWNCVLVLSLHLV